MSIDKPLAGLGHVARLTMMVATPSTWALAPNDIKSIKWVLARLDALEEIVEHFCQGEELEAFDLVAGLGEEDARE